MGYADFCRLIQKDADVILVTSEVTGPILIKFAQDVAKILPLNICESQRRYCNPFWNTAVPNKRRYPNFALKLFAKKRPFEVLEKEDQIDHLRTPRPTTG